MRRHFIHKRAIKKSTVPQNRTTRHNIPPEYNETTTLDEIFREKYSLRSCLPIPHIQISYHVHHVVSKRETFINRLNASKFYRCTRESTSEMSPVPRGSRNMSTEKEGEIGEATGNWKIPRPRGTRRGNELRNEISSLDESEDGIARTADRTLSRTFC